MPDSSTPLGGAPESSETVPASGRPGDRYGRVLSPRERRRRVRLAAVVVAALGLSALVWVGSAVLGVQVGTQDTGFVVVDGQSVDVSFVVTKPPGSIAECRVRALSPSFAEVGVKDVLVGPAADDSVPVHTRVATSEQATTGLVHSCRLIDPRADDLTRDRDPGQGLLP